MKDHAVWAFTVLWFWKFSIPVSFGQVLVPAIAQVLGATAIGSFGLFTARFVTSSIERQKQHMELYKTLYLERIAAMKALSAATGKAHYAANELASRRSLGMEHPSDEVRSAFLDCLSQSNSSGWLLGPNVYSQSHAVLKKLERLIVESGQGRDVTEIQKELTALTGNLHRAMYDEIYRSVEANALQQKKQKQGKD